MCLQGPDVDGAAAWYEARCREIESKSGLVDISLELAECAEARGISIQRSLVLALSQLQTLVYDAGCSLGLAQYQALSDSEKLRLFTAKSTRGTFVDDLRTLAAPFLSSLGEAGDSLLHDYLAEVAEERIDWCADVFDASKITEPLFALTTREAGATWMPIVPCHFADWASQPPDCIEGMTNKDVVFLRLLEIAPPLAPISKSITCMHSRRIQRIIFSHRLSTCPSLSFPLSFPSLTTFKISPLSTRYDTSADLGELLVEAGATGRNRLKLVVLITHDPDHRAHALKWGDAASSQAEGWPPLCAITISPTQGDAYSSQPLARVSRRRVIHDPVAMLRLALRCAYASNGGNSLEALNTIYTSLPERDASAVGKVREDKAYLDLQDSADEMDKHLTASEILDRYRLSKPLSFFKAAGDNPDACKAILKSMCRQLVRQVDSHATLQE